MATINGVNEEIDLDFSDLKCTDENIIGPPHRIIYIFLHQNDDQGASATQCNRTKTVTLYRPSIVRGLILRYCTTCSPALSLIFLIFLPS